MTTGPDVFLNEALVLELRIDSINFSTGVSSTMDGLSTRCDAWKFKLQ